MARADSTIRVNIIGDAKSLQRAAGQAETSVSGMNKKLVAAGAAIAGVFAVEQLVQFGDTALKEADRVGDAAGILESQLGDLAQPIIDAADEFDRLGASEGDMLDLEVAIVNIGTALGLTKEQLAGTATEAATTAAALALITDTDADTWIDQIGKAATGSERALRALGISVTDAEVVARALATTGKDTADALTDSELAAARLEIILEKLAPRIEEVTSGTGDLEQKQAQLEAKFETLTGKIGAAIEGPLNDLLGFVISGIAGFELLSQRLDSAGVSFDLVTASIRAMVAPLTLVSDLVGGLIDQLTHLDRLWPNRGPVGTQVPRVPTGGGLSGGGGLGPNKTTVVVQGGSPEAIEQAVRRAVNGIARRSGVQE